MDLIEQENIIEQEINAIRKDLPSLASLPDESLFSLVCYKYFFNNGHLDTAEYNNCFTDGKNDGGIDLVTIDYDDEGITRLVMIQSKYVSSLSNKEDIFAALYKMDNTFRNFKEIKTSEYNRNLRRILQDKISEVEDDQSVVYSFVLFWACEPSLSVKDKIERRLEEISVNYNDNLNLYQIDIFFRNQIEKQIQNVKEPKRYVEEGKIKFDRSNNYITYGENGLLVSVYASSLKKLYNMYRDEGLFEQISLYYIRNKKIDENIKYSLKKKKDKFWFLNNGIIIGCKDFSVDGNEVKLYKFSIINGCQTVTLIGEYKGKNEAVDFLLPCKIVKPEDENKYEDFIAEIAEASNSQKPISDRDLKSNKKEMRVLQRRLQENEPKIYLEIKRGQELVTPGKKKSLKDWQYLKNDLYGQLILSFHLQSPGTARNQKRKIFSVEEIYEKVFRREFDKDNIVDLLILNDYYKKFMNKVLKNEDYSDVTERNVISNGTYIILAVTGFILKVKRGLVDTKMIKNSEVWEMEVTKDELKGRIFSDLINEDLDKFEEILTGFFHELVEEIKRIYEIKEEEEKSVSNLFKSDKKYREVILKGIISKFFKEGVKGKKDLDEYYYPNLFV